MSNPIMEFATLDGLYCTHPHHIIYGHWPWNVGSLEDPDWGLSSFTVFTSGGHPVLNGSFLWNIIFVVETDCLSWCNLWSTRAQIFITHTLFIPDEVTGAIKQQTRGIYVPLLLPLWLRLNSYYYHCYWILVKRSNPMSIECVHLRLH